MIFSSPLFLFGFLPGALALYAATPARWTNLLLIAISLGFYAWGEPIFAWIALGSALLDWAVVRALAASSSNRRRKLLAALGILANLSLLVWFKYANFLYGLVAPPLGLQAMEAIALPIGVSFIVFEKITYIVDVYRGVGAPARMLGDYLLYVFLFPKLLAGPIIKYHDIEGQLTARPKRLDDVAEGLTRFSIGLGKKVLLADALGEIVDAAFAAPLGLSFSQAWLGAFAFSLQIFFDFSGYSDMAIGLARILGFRLMENFNRPFLAIGFAEFWRRWHISLSTWVRDYLYRPLRATAKPSPLRLYFILWICFLASGLWHGAAWTFIVWGAYNGFFMTLERLFLGRWLRKLPRVLGIALTFTAVTSGLAIFRSSDLTSAWLYLSVMADPGRTAAGGPFVITNDLIFVLVAGLAISFFPAFGWFERLHRIAATWRARPMIAMVSSLAILVLALGKATTITFHPFIYFRF